MSMVVMGFLLLSSIIVLFGFYCHPQPNMSTSFVGNFKFCDAAITQGLDSLSL